MILITRLLVSLWILIFFTPCVFGQASNSFTNFQIENPTALLNEYQNNLPWEGDLVEMGPLYQQVLFELNNHYEEIGKRQLDIIEKNNSGLSIVGGLNSIGLSYRKSFVDFNISVNRQLAPDLFDNERWIVTDDFTIEISASKVLSNLRDKKILSISELNYGAYAGVGFKRSYRFVHFANNYQEGLTTKFDRLFLNFMYFRNKNFLNLAPYEFLQKQDFISFNMGGVASAPIYGPLSLAAGAMAHYERIANIQIQSLGEKDNPSSGEKLRVSYEKGKVVSAGASATLQLDFLKLLKISLLSYDFSYSLTETNKTYLSFYEQDMESLKSDSELSNALDQLLKHRKANIDVLAPYVVSSEKRKEEQMESRYLLLTYGGTKSSDTQLVEIVKDGKLKEFFRHNFEKVKYVQNFFSRILSAAIKSFLKLDSLVGNKMRDAKELRMEYESSRNLIEAREKLDLAEDYENFTMSFTHEYFAQNTTGRQGNKHKENVDMFLADYTNISFHVLNSLERDEIRGPLTVTNRYQMGIDALNHLNEQTVTDVYGHIDEVCGEQSKSILSFFRSLFGGCKKKLQKKYDRYHTELWHNAYTAQTYQQCKKPKFSLFTSRKKRLLYQKCIEEASRISVAVTPQSIPLWTLKDFMQEMHVQSKTKLDMYNFFGMENVFMFGSLQATTDQNTTFHTYFNEGKFKGLGVIDRGLQDAQMRTPASIQIE